MYVLFVVMKSINDGLINAPQGKGLLLFNLFTLLIILEVDIHILLRDFPISLQSPSIKYRIVSHCISLYFIVSHCISLYLIVSGLMILPLQTKGLSIL